MHKKLRVCEHHNYNIVISTVYLKKKIIYYVFDGMGCLCLLFMMKESL